MLVDHLTRQILFSSQSVITSFSSYTTCSLTVFQHLFYDLLETIILERVVHVCMEVAVLATHQTRVILACFRYYSQSILIVHRVWIFKRYAITYVTKASCRRMQAGLTPPDTLLNGSEPAKI